MALKRRSQARRRRGSVLRHPHNYRGIDGIMPKGFQANWAPAITLHADGGAQEDRPAHERAGERHQEVLARTRHVGRADQAAERPDVHLFLVAVEPVSREGVGQLVQRRAPAASSPSQHAVAGSCSQMAACAASDTAVVTSWKTTKTIRADVHPDRCSKPPAETDRRPGQKIGHGLHPRSSAITPRDVAALSAGI